MSIQQFAEHNENLVPFLMAQAETRLEQFAQQHRVRLTKDECGDPIIRGRIDLQSNIYQYGETELGVAFITDAGTPPRTGRWNRFKAACLSAGMTLRQEGDAEGCFTFDPTNETQTKVALKGIRARTKKRMSPEMLASLAQARLKRKNPLIEGRISGEETRVAIRMTSGSVREK